MPLAACTPPLHLPNRTVLYTSAALYLWPTCSTRPARHTLPVPYTRRHNRFDSIMQAAHNTSCDCRARAGSCLLDVERCVPCTAHLFCTHILAASTFVRNKLPSTALLAGPSAARPQISQTLHMLTCSYTQSAGSYKHRFTRMHTTTATSYPAVRTTRWRKGRVFLRAANQQQHGCTRTPPTY